ncbi:MAG: hypothetical protein JNN07_21965 [Verrucomicrobiales bacterium]|nr:hypothetical protein [Verrucomicrobiales bacterium]
MESVKISFGNTKPGYSSFGSALRMLVFVTVREHQQGFVVVGEVSDAKYDASKLEQQLRHSVVDWLRQGRIRNLFQETTMRVQASDAIATEDEAEVLVEETVAAALDEQVKLGNAAIARIDKTIEEMCEACREPFDAFEMLSDGMIALRGIDCASGDFMWDAWRAEKLGALDVKLKNLASAKDTNHPTYANLGNEIRSILTGWRRQLSNVWIDNPPGPR